MPFENVEEAFNSDEGKAAFQAMIDKEKEGWQETSEADTAGLKAAKDKILDELKVAKESAKVWDGYDPEQVKTLMDKMSTDVELKLIAEGKHDEAFDLRVTSMKKDHKGQLKVRDGKIAESETEIAKLNEELTALIIDGTIREAYVGLGFEPSAMRDQIRSGRDVFKRDETGNAIPRDIHGNILYSKDGTTPMTAGEWLEAESETKKYLRPASSGSGAQQGGRHSTGFDSSSATSTQRIAHGLEKLGMGQ